MEEKRRATRRTLKHYMSVFDRHSHAYLGMLVELSDSGFKLTSPKKIELQLSYHLALADSPTLNEADTIAFFEAASIWCEQKSGAFYDSGFKFVEVSHLTKEIFQDLL
ncbi:MAG TPA: hypothetical protein DCZ03_10710 [Gammaproteobacteria bacterium]|nr:hypothetical protein [Gammaproteobacteria bacterium]